MGESADVVSVTKGLGSACRALIRAERPVGPASEPVTW
jgi:hypothetical protein